MARQACYRVIAILLCLLYCCATLLAGIICCNSFICYFALVMLIFLHTAPCITFELSSYNTTCYGTSDGGAMVRVLSGFGPFTYLLLLFLTLSQKLVPISLSSYLHTFPKLLSSFHAK